MAVLAYSLSAEVSGPQAPRTSVYIRVMGSSNIETVTAVLRWNHPPGLGVDPRVKVMNSSLPDAFQSRIDGAGQ